MKKIDIPQLLQILFPPTLRGDTVWLFALDGAGAPGGASAAPLGGAAELALLA